MQADYVTLFAFALIAAAFAVGALLSAWLLRPKVYDPIKATTYECGMTALGTTETKTNIRFYVFALLFVLFDVETLYVYPWAVTAKALGTVAMIEMFIFLAVLFLGLIYAWCKGALQWE